MDNDENGAGTLEERDALRKLKQDYFSESLGWPAGRLRRFFFHASDAAHGDADHDEDAEFTRAMLAQIVSDQNQRRIERLQNEMILAETASYEALIAARETLAKTMQRLQELQAIAHILPDGRRVFLSEDGSYAIDEDLNLLIDSDMAQVEWQQGRPSAETYTEAHHDNSAAADAVTEIEEYRDELEKNRTALAGDKNLSDDEIAAIEDDIADMPELVMDNYGSMGGTLRMQTAASSPNNVQLDDVVVSTSVALKR
ncbi:MAG: hypothetical protein AAGA97_00960 [Pseudomonadota bacterium]